MAFLFKILIQMRLLSIDKAIWIYAFAKFSCMLNLVDLQCDKESGSSTFLAHRSYVLLSDCDKNQTR